MKTIQIACAAILLLIPLGCTAENDTAKGRTMSAVEFRRRMPDLVERAKKNIDQKSPFQYSLLELRVERSYLADLAFLHDQQPTWESLVIRSSDVGLNTFEFETLIDIANLKSLQIPYISEEAFRRLHELNSIEELSISNGGSVHNHLRALELQRESLPLTSLAISNVYGVKGAGKIFPSRLPRLERLDLSYTDVTDEDLVHISELDHLTHLNLSNTNITPTGLRHLMECDSLEYVNVRGTSISAGIFEKLNFKLIDDSQR